MDIIPQIIGLLAVATFLLSYQQKERKNIILFNTVSRCLYILQYIFLGAYSGAVLDVLGAISSVVAGNRRCFNNMFNRNCYDKTPKRRKYRCKKNLLCELY